MSHIAEYYVKQAQTGSGMGYFAGSSTQKGAGIGSLLGGLFRSIFPFLKQGAATVGREALRAGSHILADAATGGVPLSTSVKDHFSQAGRNLMNKMHGRGIKRGRSKRKLQSSKSPRAKKTYKKDQTDKHIF